MTEIKCDNNGLPRVPWDIKYENILINLWKHNLNGFRKHSQIHQDMADHLQKAGLNVMGRDVQTKMNNLGRKYRIEKRKATKWVHFNEMHDILSNMENNSDEYDNIIKCGEVQLIKNVWNLQLACAQCGKKMTEIKEFLLHSLQHHFSVTENEINKLISQISSEKLDEESEESNLPTNADICVGQNYIVKEEYEVMDTGIEQMKKYSEKEEAFGNHVEDEDFLCKHCRKAFDNITDYVQHVEQHVEFEVYDCPKCDQFNATFMQLKEHIKLHVKDQKNTLRYNENPNKSIYGYITTPTDQKHNEATCEVSSNILTDVTMRNVKNEEVNDELEEFYAENLLSISKNTVQNEDKEFQRVQLIQHSDLKETDEIESPYNLENETINHHHSTIHQKHVMDILQATSPTNTEPEDPKDQQVNIILLSDCSDNEEFIISHEGTIYNNSITHQHISVRQKQKRKKLKEYKCDVCQKLFPKLRSLTLHKRRHENATLFSCEHCGTSFAHSSNLTTHLKRHLGIKEHKCTLCGKSFVTTTELKIHMRFHTGERPYECEQCKSTFITTSTYRAHCRRHTNERKYCCQTCGKGYFENKDLKSHLISHAECGRRAHLSNI